MIYRNLILTERRRAITRATPFWNLSNKKNISKSSVRPSLTGGSTVYESHLTKRTTTSPKCITRKNNASRTYASSRIQFCNRIAASLS